MSVAGGVKVLLYVIENKEREGAGRCFTIRL